MTLPFYDDLFMPSTIICFLILWSTRLCPEKNSGFAAMTKAQLLNERKTRIFKAIALEKPGAFSFLITAVLVEIWKVQKPAICKPSLQ